MEQRKILLGIREDARGYRMVDLAYRLRDLGHYAKVLRTEISENYVPLSCIDDLFEEEEQHFDLCVISPSDGRPFRTDDRTDELAGYLLGRNIPVLCMDEWDDAQQIEETIQVELKGSSLEGYSFLVTLGLFHEHLTTSHYIGVYGRDELILALIREIALEGGFVSVIAGKGVPRIPYASEVLQVDNVEEYKLALDSRVFRFDVVLDAIRIPRFGLAKGERFKIEYQRYFAEFAETHLPFEEEGSCSDNQLVVEVINGRDDNPESIRYLFDNSRVGLVMQSEIDRETGGYKPFVKLIARDGSVEAIAYKEEALFCRTLLKEFLAKLEG